MAQNAYPHVVLRTFAALTLVAAVTGLPACDKDDGDAADGEGDTDGHEGTVDDQTACERNPQGDTYAVGLSKEGEGIKVAFVDADPAPPAKGYNTWDVMVTDLADAPLTEVELSVSPFMPAHNHGSPTTVVVTPGEMDGEYILDKVDLFMAGLWEVIITVETDESTSDSVTFEFCIDP